MIKAITRVFKSDNYGYIKNKSILLDLKFTKALFK
jgi:hypothetical protein